MMRPSNPGPTGTAIGWPVSVTSWPRTRSFGGVHGDGAHGILAEMLRHFENEAIALVLRFQRIEDRRQIALELHVDDGADDLRDTSGLISFGHVVLLLGYGCHNASAPEMISISSFVIIA